MSDIKARSPRGADTVASTSMETSAMPGVPFIRGLSLLLAAAVLNACEKHPAAAVRGSPEYLHAALTGDVDAQKAIADCYAGGGCVGIPQDGALACAWRGIRLASQSPTLALSDSTGFVASCASEDPTFRQRSTLAFANLSARVYARPSPPLPQLLAKASGRPLLHPSLEALRAGANAELLTMHGRDHLPQFGKPTVSGENLAWSSCAPAICLEGVTPSFGGGVVSYRIKVRAEGTTASQLAASLAAGALETPALADALSRPGTPARELGGVCWRIESGKGTTSVEATSGDCVARVG